jgi:hypothetical protein
MFFVQLRIAHDALHPRHGRARRPLRLGELDGNRPAHGRALRQGGARGSRRRRQEQAVGFEWAELTECPQSSVQQTISCNAYLSVRGATGDNSSSVFSLLADVAKPDRHGLVWQSIEGHGAQRRTAEEFYVLLDLPRRRPTPSR